MKLISHLFTSRKIALGAVSLLSLTSIATAEPLADANPFERSAFGNDWGILSSDIFGGADVLFGLSPATRTFFLTDTQESSKKASYSIVQDASKNEEPSGIAGFLGSPFARGGGAVSPAALSAIKQFDGGTGANVDPAVGTSTSWGVSSAWRPDGVPTSTDDVLFDNAFRDPLQNVQLGGANRVANSITLSLTTDQTWSLGASSGIGNATLAITTGNITRTSTTNNSLNTIGAVSGTGIGTGVMTLSTPAAGFTFTNLDTTGDLQINAIISGATKTVTIAGPGTTIFSAANTYTGGTTINSGTLNLAAEDTLGSTSNVTVNTGGTLLFSNAGTTDRINDAAEMTLNGGTFNTAGLSEHGANANDAGIGALTLMSSSIIDMGNLSSILAFADSATETWTGTLSIYNWSGTPITGDGTDQLYFGDNALGLTPIQLTQISFYSDAGNTFIGTGAWGTDLDGEVVPVPEPGTWAGAALALLAIGFTQRRRFRSLLAQRA
jgi:autotransporter-associated beta strand protein